MPKKPEGQLELFDMQNAQAPQPRKVSTGRVHFNLRHDQLILIGIGGLIGMTVVFASGVERGKKLVRSERFVQQRAEAAPVEVEPEHATAYAAPPVQQQRLADAAPAKPDAEENLIKIKLEPQAETAIKPEPVQATDKRYAIQVVTYQTREYAEKELQRLQDKGEPGFIVSGEKHSVLYVGPFASKDLAKEKLSSLRSRYSDCFIKTL